MDKFFQLIRDKNIHIVGITGAEGSSVLSLLVKCGHPKITGHDFLGDNSLEKSFKLWHKGLDTKDRNKLFKGFEDDIHSIKTYTDGNYLQDIQKADIIFAPQSWRLYPKQNAVLFDLAKRKSVQFYSITRLYLDYAPSTIIAVTGTVGKGSVSHLISKLLTFAGKKIYFAGNDTWTVQVADLLPHMEKDSFLILEISHRQLMDGFSKAPHIGVCINLYPNHLDEVSWREYITLKWSLFQKQKSTDYSVLNYDNDQIKDMSKSLDSQKVYFSENEREMNTKSIQKIFSQIMDIKSVHYKSNILAALTVIDLLHIPMDQILNEVKSAKSLPARCELIARKSNISFFDDIKSTTPWATMAAVSALPNSLLILGGKTKGINYQSFIKFLRTKNKKIFFLKSEISDVLASHLPADTYVVVNNLRDAIYQAYDQAKSGENIVISPAGAFFYSLFIKGKDSIRKLITSLPPKEPLVRDLR